MMTSQEKNNLSLRARTVLDANFNGQFTRPASTLYPHQRSWHTGFIALGVATYDWNRAVAEMQRLFRGQWANGMLPHIVFADNPESPYFPDPDFWRTHLHKAAPNHVKTSGITQPPVHAFVIWELYQRAPGPSQGKELLKWFFPRLQKLHNYLYTHRDPTDEGLICIRHPWESGTDNSPLWDNALSAIDLDRSSLPVYTRQDIPTEAARLQRTTDADYDHYVHLADLFRRMGYDDAAINEETPFLVQDPLYNAILCRSNECLLDIAHTLGEDPQELFLWHELSLYSFNEKLWDEEKGYYVAYDVVANRAIPYPTINGVLPLLAPVADQEQAEILLATLAGPTFGYDQDHLLCASTGVHTSVFDAARYWRGPVWINTNWMLYEGLLRYDMTAAAERIKQDSLALLQQYGCYEFFDPRPGGGKRVGYGTPQCSWSAALALRWLG